jgi:hypothetical protein
MHNLYFKRWTGGDCLAVLDMLRQLIIAAVATEIGHLQPLEIVLQMLAGWHSLLVIGT